MKKISFFSLLIILWLFATGEGIAQVKTFYLSVHQPSENHCIPCQCKTFDNRLRIFPNPSEGKITLEFYVPSTGTSALIQIFTQDGVILKSSEEFVMRTFFQMEFDLSSLSRGLYLVRVIEASFTETRKIFIY